MRTCTTTMTSAICPSLTEVNQRLLLPCPLDKYANYDEQLNNIKQYVYPVVQASFFFFFFFFFLRFATEVIANFNPQQEVRFSLWKKLVP